MIFNMMNYGSGGSLEDAYAIIRVTYPSGSACTCEKNDHSYTFEAPDTSGVAIFAVPESGSWIVSCTNGTSTATDTVQVNTKNAVYEKTLSYAPSPGPTPTPTYETKIVASGYIRGVINAMAVSGDWNGGDPTIGTGRTFVVPEVNTYVVVFVPEDGSGAKYYSVDVNQLHMTYQVNLQTGDISIIDPSGGGGGGEPSESTTLSVAYPSGTINVTGQSVSYDQTASGRSQTNTATFILISGETYSVTFTASNSSATQTRNVTCYGETMSVTFVSGDPTTLIANKLTYAPISGLAAGSGTSSSDVTEWVEPSETFYSHSGGKIAAWYEAFSLFGEHVVFRFILTGEEYTYKAVTITPNQENSVYIDW